MHTLGIKGIAVFVLCHSQVFQLCIGPKGDFEGSCGNDKFFDTSSFMHVESPHTT